MQGVGYPNPNRSHFESMDIWHTAHRQSERPPLGWLGRYLDEAAQQMGGDAAAMHLGAEIQPLALAARHVRAVSVQSLKRFRLQGADDDVRAATEAADAPRRCGQWSAGLRADQHDVGLFSQPPRRASVGHYKSDATYPSTELAQKLSTIAQLIDAGLETRIYYVTLDGFDTHANQAVPLSSLLRQLGDATQAFVDDLTQHQHAERVLLMTFSEFGRRVKENASKGTDHGAAAPMFLAGGRVKPGLIGAHPSLTDLSDGDLKHHTDFRQVYATVLEDWLGAKGPAILGQQFQTLPLLTKA